MTLIDKRMRMLAFVAAALTVLACGPKDDEPGGGDKPRPTAACNLVESEPPHRHGKGVEAAVTAYCDPAPQAHVLTIWLEREGSDGKSFFQVGPEQRYTTVPPKNGQVFPVVYAGCVDGQWRVRARAEGSGPDGIPFKFALPLDESHIAIIKCS
ncbi:hypothetical protein AB0B10_25745 [Micromonospora arborensis]|uniref:hypothetical protein n=1 Tax=Micromonospora arborensis TaxID=2116518 RepID=UPI0033DD94C8